MIVELLLFVLFSAAVFLKLQWEKTSRYWADKGVQFSPPHPIFGSLTFLQKENPAFWLKRLHEQFKGPYVGIWLFWRPALVIHCPEIARRVLVKDSDVFRNRFSSSGKSDPIGSLNIFTLDDPMWTNIRRRLTAVFTSSKLRSMEGLIKCKTADLIERIRSETKKNPEKTTDVRVVCTDYSTDIIGEAAFGIKSEAVRTGDSVIRKVTRDFMKFTVFRGLAWSSIFFCPSLVDYFGFTLFPKDTIAFLRLLFRRVVEQRGGYDKPVKDPVDLLDTLLKLKQDASADNEDISEDMIVAQAAVFVHAGFDSTGSALTFTLIELAHQPDIQEKLYQALIEAQEKFGKELDSAALTEVPYLNAVIKETLRKYPAMGWLDRVASKPYAIDAKLTVPAGTVVYVNTLGMMRDRAHFPRPHLYDPDRFMPHNEKNIQPYVYMPFGEGPRICIGMRFAYQSLRSALAAVSLQFTVRAAAGAPRPDDCPIDKRHMFQVPAGATPLIFTDRH